MWGLVCDHLSDSPIGERGGGQLLDMVRLEAELLTGAETPPVTELLLKATRIICNCD